jgi:hypothetical protein
MRSQARQNWNPSRNAVGVAIPFPSGFEEVSMRETLGAVVDTLIVLGMQLVFRVTTVLRHLNY